MFTVYIAQISMCIWSNALYNIDNLCYYMHQYIVPSTLTNQLSYLRLQFFIIIIFQLLSTIYPNPPCQLPCGRKPENPEKTHDFRRVTVDELFPRVIKCPNTQSLWRLGHRSPNTQSSMLNKWILNIYTK